MKAAQQSQSMTSDVGRVAQAELEASGYVPKAMQSLKSLGKWTLELAGEVWAGWCSQND